MADLPGGAVDVAIVGGGIVGCAAAAFLAEAGASVVLIEREGVAAAASGRNSGVVQRPLDPVLGALYAETVELYRAFDAGTDDFGLPGEPAGLLYASRRDGVAAALAAELAAGYPELDPVFLDGPALQAIEPALDPAVQACRLAIGYPVVPGAATRAFAARAERAGAGLVLGQGRLAVEDGRATGVSVGGRLVAAGAVVVAAGPWTPSLVDPTGAWRPIRPLWGVVADVALADPPHHVIEEAEIDTTIEPGGEGGVPVSFSLVTAGGMSVLGSTFLEEEPDAEALVPALVDHGATFVPAIGSAGVLGWRRCARPLSADGRPLVGPLPWIARGFVAAGHGPWGISTGPAAARMVADAVMGRDAGIPGTLDPGRFGGPAG